ncbi:MAG: ABC transporter ATP-binding protein/permease, partial [Clostridia bacterium]
MLKLVDITKEYKVDEESILALHGVDIEFRKCEFVSILGPSGCGKTTLLNIIGGLDRYTSGDIQVEGISTKQYDDVDWDTYRNRKIGFVFQSYNLIPHLTIIKNVSMSLTLAGVNKDEAKSRALEALRKVGLDSQARKKPNQLSGGQMQRVAIARALVNNPEIILADEPTGALDSESGIQIMDLLKEVAEDRLVIMVTHNPLLAEDYSTRIVYLKDGEVVNDTMPYDCSIEKKAAVEQTTAEAVSSVSVDAVADDASAKEKDKKPCCCCSTKPQKQSRFQRMHLKRRAQDRSSMKVKTAISLSFTNLLSKKGRTLLTCIAGSIGIIGILLVMSLSAGIDGYVTKLEENALSQYPIQISEKNVDLTSVMQVLTPSDSGRQDYPGGDTIYTQGILGNILENADQMFGKNDLVSLKKHIDQNFDGHWGQVKYDYGTAFNVYSKNLKSQTDYIKVHPFADAMSGMMGGVSSDLIPDELSGMLEQYAYMLDAWDEISTSQQLLNQQYDVLSGSWPAANDENGLVLVLEKKNQINDYALFMLGLIDPSEALDAIVKGTLASRTFNINDLVGLEYTVVPNTAYLTEIAGVTVDGNQAYKLPKSSERGSGKAEFIDNAKDSVKLKVSCVVRPKPEAVVTSINSVIGYTHALTERMIESANKNSAIKAFQQSVKEAQIGGGDLNMVSPITMTFKNSTTNEPMQYEAGSSETLIKTIADANEMLRELGVVDLDHPKAIRIFCSTFDSKDKIVAMLNNYTEGVGTNQHKVKVHYTDYLEMMMGFVKTMTKTVTGALIGFSAISLIVSTIMIAIIIYTSVLERRKEIGVLRSLGARKKDVSRVFIAESAMIGAYSGVIGLIFSGLLTLVGNAILVSIFKIPNLMAMKWWQCVLMFIISVFLSMFAGFIPS